MSAGVRATGADGRPAEPGEIASASTFLASAEASYITGVNLVVDGGVTAKTGQPDFDQLFSTARASRNSQES